MLNNPQYLLYDGHGSTRQLVKWTGSDIAVVDTYSYDGYGVLLQDKAFLTPNNGPYDPGYTPQQATSLLYSGEQFDSDCQQYYLRARYYNPSNGIFNRMDPYSGNTQDPQSLHKYAYCHNNPVNMVDPSGNMGSLVGALSVQSIIAVAIASLAPAIMAAYDSAKAGLSWFEIGKNAALAWAISFGIGIGIMLVAPYILAAATWLLTLIPGVTAFAAQIAILLAFVGLAAWGLKSVWTSDYPLSIKISVTLIFAVSVVVSLGKDGIKQLASGAKNVISKLNGSSNKGPAPKTGTKVWRVYGEKNNPMGESWTDIDPSTVNNYRNSAGLPDSNTGRFIVEGKIIDNTDVWTRSALPLDGNTGGLSEVLIPNAASKVQVTNVSGVNPPF